MTPSALIRASGLSAIVGGLGFVLFPLLHPNHDAAGYTSWIWVPAHMAPNVGAILVLFGLVGLLVRQLERAGWLGLVGFVVAFFGVAAALAWLPGYFSPSEDTDATQVVVANPAKATARGGMDEGVMDLRGLMFQVGAAAMQVAAAGHTEEARRILADTRRALYTILAEDPGDRGEA